MGAYPIWLDYYVNFGSAESVQYRILCNNDLVYSGKAWIKPGENNILVRINDICADYINNVLPTLGVTFTTNEPPLFRIQKWDGSGYVAHTSVSFYNNWSYDYDFDPHDNLSFPINGRLDPRQWIVYTAYEASEFRARVIKNNGEYFFVTIPVGLSDDFNSDFNSDFCKMVATRAGTAVFNLSKYGSDIKRVEIDGKKYEMTDKCNRYALYYTNAYGGWDSLLIEGNHVESDDVTRHTRDVEYNNKSIQNRGRKNYVNEVSRRLTLHTSWMSDEQSLKMHHLLNSAEVYLYDITTDQMIPVVLTNGTSEYKTYKSNGNKLVNYTIEVALANDRIRR
jgi:hypothetical protein